MESTFSNPVPDAVKSASRDAQRLGNDVKNDLADAVSRGRDIAGNFASEGREAADELSKRGRAAAENARADVKEGRDRLSKAAERVSGYADDNTALVAVGAFGVGLLVGFLVNRRAS
jgi:ElaB/YqjD/DUF883 family membrane-anchored ribosome-binding protein